MLYDAMPYDHLSTSIEFNRSRLFTSSPIHLREKQHFVRLQTLINSRESIEHNINIKHIDIEYVTLTHRERTLHRWIDDIGV